MLMMTAGLYQVFFDENGFAGVDTLHITENTKDSNRINYQTIMEEENIHMSNEVMNQGKWKEYREHRQSPWLEE